MTTLLAIESSCDDTSAAVLRDDHLLSNVIASQKVHEQYGGVVPELASRAHQQNIIPVVDAAIRQAGIGKDEIDAVGFTRGPGLLGSLLVGVSFAKSFATALGKPLIEVNHLQAHVLSHFIERGEPKPQFPFICLLVSGGHTQILLLKDYFDIECLGTTIDDAAGEAIDKAGEQMQQEVDQQIGEKRYDQQHQQGLPQALENVSEHPDTSLCFSLSCVVSDTMIA